MSNPSRRDRFSIRSEAFELARSGKYAMKHSARELTHFGTGQRRRGSH